MIFYVLPIYIYIKKEEKNTTNISAILNDKLYVLMNNLSLGNCLISERDIYLKLYLKEKIL